MIDLHVHLLPGVDDGPSTPKAALEMARVAVADGIRTVAATPHVSARYRTPPQAIADMVAGLQNLLHAESVPLRVLTGAEVAPERLHELGDDDLRLLTLGGGPYLLLECPFEASYPLSEHVADLQARGYGVLLAHPERAPFLRRDPAEVARLVASGAMTAISGGSLAGHFGDSARRFAGTLLASGLVHVVASDGHAATGRPPVLRAHLKAARRAFPGLEHHRYYFTEVVPSTILAGERPPVPPRVAQGGALARFLRVS